MKKSNVKAIGKNLALLATALFLVVSFASCKGKTTGDASAKSSVKLVYWSMWNQTEPQGMVIEQAIADFEKKEPWCFG